MIELFLSRGLFRTSLEDDVRMEDVVVGRVSILLLNCLVRHVETSNDRLVLGQLALVRLLGLVARDRLQQIAGVSLLSRGRELWGECAALKLCFHPLSGSLSALGTKLAGLFVKPLVSVRTTLSREFE